MDDARDRTDRAWARAVGAAMRERRREVGLSQERLAFASKLDRTYISGVERARRNPTVQTLRRIALALRWQPSQLLAAAEDLYDST